FGLGGGSGGVTGNRAMRALSRALALRAAISALCRGCGKSQETRGYRVLDGHGGLRPDVYLGRASGAGYPGMGSEVATARRHAPKGDAEVSVWPYPRTTTP